MSILLAATTTTTDSQRDAQATSLPSIPVIPAPMTGQLPHKGPLLVRGRAYCSTDFPWRAAVWFAQEWQKREEEHKKRTVVGRVKAHKTLAAPTRIQPARAAKTKRKHEEEEAVQKARHPAKRGKMVKTATTSADEYEMDWSEGDRSCSNGCGCIGDGEDGNTPAGIFQRMVSDVLVDVKTAEVGDRRKTATAGRSPALCTLAAQPLACTDMAFCLHGLRKTVTHADWPQAPEAPMESCLSPVTDQVQIYVGQGLDDEAHHVEQRTVEICGLRFAVDRCNGGTRVVMT